MTKSNKPCFSCRLRTLFTLTDCTHEELARYVGVSVPMVQLWEDGIKTPDVYQFYAIAKYFGLPYSWFLDGTDHALEVTKLAQYLGLSVDTVQRLIQLSKTKSGCVLDLLDDAIYTLTIVIQEADEQDQQNQKQENKQEQGQKK